MNNSIFILLGSNMDDRLNYLSLACEEISRWIGSIITVSSIYKTAAWGNIDQPDFYNQVIEIQSDLKAKELLLQLLEIEKKLGRVRTAKWGPRIIDIDLLLYGNVVITTEDLVVPHPEIPNRRFTLLPLHEISPDFVHPTQYKTISQLLLDCRDTLPVEKMEL